MKMSKSLAFSTLPMASFSNYLLTCLLQQLLAWKHGGQRVGTINKRITFSGYPCSERSPNRLIFFLKGGFLMPSLKRVREIEAEWTFGYICEQVFKARKMQRLSHDTMSHLNPILSLWITSSESNKKQSSFKLECTHVERSYSNGKKERLFLSVVTIAITCKIGPRFRARADLYKLKEFKFLWWALL